MKIQPVYIGLFNDSYRTMSEMEEEIESNILTLTRTNHGEYNKTDYLNRLYFQRGLFPIKFIFIYLRAYEFSVISVILDYNNKQIVQNLALLR